MIAFPNDLVDIYETKETGGVDYEGNPIYEDAFIISCYGNFQELSSYEIANAAGKMNQGTNKVYLPIEVADKINSRCKVRINDKGPLYEVIGTPMVREDFIPHIRVMLLEEGYVSSE